MKNYTLEILGDSMTIKGAKGEFTFEFSQRRKKSYKTNISKVLCNYGTDAINDILQQEKLFTGK